MTENVGERIQQSYPRESVPDKIHLPADFRHCGNYKWVEINALQEEDGTHKKHQSSNRNLLPIDDYKRLETSLRDAKEELEITNSSLSSVLSLAHVLPWDCDVRR